MAKKMKGVTSITRNGSTYWYAQVDGRRAYCGKDEKGRKLAEAARSKYVGRKYENREVQAGLKTRKAEFRTVKELCDWYMTLPGIQKQKNYRSRIGHAKHILDYFGNLPVGTVDGTEQERYRERRGAEGAAPGSINNEIALLSAMYHLALKDRKILPEQTPGRFPMEKGINPRRVLTEDEAESLITHAGDEGFRDVIICGYETAMRSREIQNLRAGQVHLDQTRITNGRKVVVDFIDLGIFDTKTQTRRTVPVSLRLKEILVRRLLGLGPDDHVFRTADGDLFSTTMIDERLKVVCKRAGIPYGDKAVNAKGERVGVVFHCLRHTRTTRWVEAGFSDEIIRRATGHKSLEAYRTYIKLDPSVVMRLVAPGAEVYKTGIKSPQKAINSEVT
jgi:integrase